MVGIFLFVLLVVLTYLWHLDLPDDELRAGGGSVVALGFASAHSVATIHRVHAVHIRAWTHTMIIFRNLQQYTSCRVTPDVSNTH